MKITGCHVPALFPVICGKFGCDAPAKPVRMPGMKRKNQVELLHLSLCKKIKQSPHFNVWKGYILVIHLKIFHDLHTLFVQSWIKLMKRSWIFVVILKSPWIWLSPWKVLDFFIRSWKGFEIHYLVYAKPFSVKLDYFTEEILAHPLCKNL